MGRWGDAGSGVWAFVVGGGPGAVACRGSLKIDTAIASTCVDRCRQYRACDDLVVYWNCYDNWSP